MSTLIKVCNNKDFPIITSVGCPRIDLIGGCHDSSRYVIDRRYHTRDFLGSSEHIHFNEPILLITSINISTRYKNGDIVMTCITKATSYFDMKSRDIRAISILNGTIITNTRLSRMDNRTFTELSFWLDDNSHKAHIFVHGDGVDK